MKGTLKAMKRTPHIFTSKVGMSQKSSDAEFDDYNRKFGAIEQYAQKLLKDSVVFRDNVSSMLTAGAEFGRVFYEVFQPHGSEYGLEKKHPSSADTIANISQYQTHLEELRETLLPEIELIDSRIVAPVKEFQEILKKIRKTITKRDHKLIDYDRYNNSYTKLRDKKEKSLKDEQNLFKLEQDFEAAASEYEHYNGIMKEELPRFFDLATQFITPLFYSFYYVQLNVYYLVLEKVQVFAEGKIDLQSGTVEDNYAAQLGDTISQLEALTIQKRLPPSSALLKKKDSNSSGASASASSATSPPPYSAGAGVSRTASSVSGKRAPPPPPPLKPKPGAAPQIKYVKALYDFTAQAEGDLSFRAGDRIELVERTPSSEDWWTGKINGAQGVFPGNYVEEE